MKTNIDKQTLQKIIDIKVAELDNIKYYLKFHEQETLNNDLTDQINSLKEENEKLLKYKTSTVPASKKFFADKTLCEIEEEAILATLDFYGGNKSSAARSLGITIKTLYNKLHEFGKLE